MFDWARRIFGRGGKVVGEAKYILKRQGPGGGMKRVEELVGPSSPDVLTPHLEPGIYAMDAYRKGQSGFERIWGPVQVVGEEVVGAEKTGTISKKPVGAGSTFLNMMRSIAEMKEEAKGEYEVLKDIFEEKTITADDLIDAMDTLKSRHTKLDGLFGERTSGEESVKYTGELPVLMHPKAIDGLLQVIENRLDRWGRKFGLLEEEGKGSMPEGPLMKFPEKPKTVSEPKGEIEADVVEVEKEEEETEQSD